MTQPDDRLAAIEARLRAAGRSPVVEITAELALELADIVASYRDARERLERIGPAVPPTENYMRDECLWCTGYGKRRIMQPHHHDTDCPWRIAREHLEAE